MSRPAVGITKFLASDAVLADKSILNHALSLISKLPGVLGTYSGFELQEPQYFWLAVVWVSVEHHITAIADTQTYEPITQALIPGKLTPVFRDHITFSAEPYTALGLPATEFAVWTVHEGGDRQYFQEKLAQLIEVILSMPPPPNARLSHSGGWGPFLENDRQFMVMLGWESLEIFQETFADAPEAHEIIVELKSLAALDLKHAALTKFYDAN